MHGAVFVNQFTAAGVASLYQLTLNGVIVTMMAIIYKHDLSRAVEP